MVMEQALPRGAEWRTVGWGWGSPLIAGFALYLVLYLTWQVAGWGGPEHRSLISNLAFLPTLGVACLLAAGVARKRSLDPRVRRAWAVIALAYACSWAGDIIWLIYESVLKRTPFPSPADAAYLLFYPVLLAGLLLFPHGPRERSDRWRFLLDAAIVFVASTMAVWFLVLRPVSEHSDGGVLRAALALAYPAGDLVLVTGLAAVLLRGRSFAPRDPLALLTVAVFVLVIADLLFAYLSLHGTYASGGFTDSLFMVSQFLLALAAYRQWAAAPVASKAPAARGTSLTFLPYIAMVLGYGLLLTGARAGHHDGAHSGLIVGAVVLTALVVLRQIAALRENDRLVEEIRRREARFRSLIQNASDVIIVVDEDRVVQFISPSVEQVLGYSPDRLVGRPFGAAVHPDDLAAIQRLVDDGAIVPGAALPIEVRARHANGVWQTFEVQLTDGRDDPGVGGIVINARHISERKALEGLLRHQAFHDALTGLPNRASFVERLDQALARAGRADAPLAVIFLDLDGFKLVNDSLGHPAGDALLRQVAERLTAILRPGELVARFGGDEFTVLLERISHPEAALQAAERICSGLARPFALLGSEIEVGVSAGIAIPDGAPVDAEELLRRADIALYQAKALGKRRAVLFDRRMEARNLERLTLAAELRHAVDEGGLRLAYQPEVDLHTGVVTGVEALLRWTHPALGVISPDRFIPLAEETGLIIPIGRWVLEEACRQGHAWEALRPDGPPLVVSVNLSARQFAQPELVREVARILHQTNLEPHGLRLELTESLLIEDAETAQQTLEALTRLGVRLALDDFGAGYSSLGYLHRFDVGAMKIDRSFIQRIEVDARGRAVVRAMTATAHALEMDVTAEGLETAGQVDAARALGCDRGQGYFFAPALPVDAVEPFLSRGYVAPLEFGAAAD